MTTNKTESTIDILEQLSLHHRHSKIKSQKEIDAEIHDNQVKDSTQVRWLRWILAGVIVSIAIAHMGILYYFLDKSGNHNLLMHKPFISDKVMLMFLGTTTADVFGLLFVLVRFLFPNSKKIN